jgi:aminomethyltransferase
LILSDPTLKRTPLYETHKALGARFTEFGGWEMPVFYSGIIEEHHTVRKAVGLFDVSHMGQIRISGPDALTYLQYMTTNEVSYLEIGQAEYSLLCNEKGGIIDDIICYKLSPSVFFICVNASNADKDFAWLLKQRASFNCEIKNESATWAQLALQGPMASNALRPLLKIDPSSIKHFRFAQVQLLACDVILARTGYTGEDGFEIFCPPSKVVDLWNELLKSGATFGIKPIGLGARDTLRTEMKYTLYGNEITESTTPLEANLGWVVKFEKDFIGRKALLEQKTLGIKKKLVGFEMTGRGIARHGYPIFDAGQREIGIVTSGTMSPMLNKAIGIGYVETPMSNIGQEILIKIREQLVEAKVVKTPFYQHEKI